VKYYTPDELRQLGEIRRAEGAASPYRCPACGERQVRIISYASTHGDVTKTMGYAWCRACRRYTGWTSVYSPKVPDILDGLTELQRTRFRELSGGEDLDSFFGYLDELTAD
jgi:hypothetical protein